MAESLTKSYTTHLKDGNDEGHIVAQFAVSNEIDSDGDVTLPGAFGKQDVLLSPGVTPPGAGVPGTRGRATPPVQPPALSAPKVEDLSIFWL